MSRQGGGRAPVGLGVWAAVVGLAAAAYVALHALRLRNLPPALSAPAALLQRGQTSMVTTAIAAEREPIVLAPDVLFARNSPAVVRINVHDGSMRPMGHGTGFFVSADGLAVTNHHVIDGAHYASVQRSDGSVLRVEGVAALDPPADLALLKVAAEGHALPTLALGPDEPPPVGTTVYAIGHPLGLKNVLSEGLVSGLGDPAQGQHFIQTTAAISPGSSRGPLMTADGAVVGVTTATVRSAQNLNFAMPAARVRWLLNQPHDPRPMSLADTARAATPPASAAALNAAIDRIWDAMRQDELTRAAHLVDQFRERGRDSAYYWFTCGCLHIRLNNDDLAVDAFRRSLQLKPDKVATYLNLGQMYARQGKLRDAIATYEAAATYGPNDPRIYAQAGDTYMRHKQPNAAASFFRRGVALDPRNATYERALGLACLTSGRPAEALAPLRNAAALEPQVADHHPNLGIVLLDLRRHAEGARRDEAGGRRKAR